MPNTCIKCWSQFWALCVSCYSRDFSILKSWGFLVIGFMFSLYWISCLVQDWASESGGWLSHMRKGTREHECLVLDVLNRSTALPFPPVWDTLQVKSHSRGTGSQMLACAKITWNSCWSTDWLNLLPCILGSSTMIERGYKMEPWKPECLALIQTWCLTEI